MKTTFTPGPWRVGKMYDGKDSWGGDYYSIAIYDCASTAKIAQVESWFGAQETIECNANADLIAAAPDLLQALQRLADVAIKPDNFTESEHRRTLDAALNNACFVMSKARGEL